MEDGRCLRAVVDPINAHAVLASSSRNNTRTRGITDNPSHSSDKGNTATSLQLNNHLLETLPPGDVIRFASRRGLVSWSFIGSDRYKAIQIVMPDESSATKLKEQIRSHHGELHELTVRQSPSQGGRWVVQMPLKEAVVEELLPRRITFHNAVKKLPFSRAPGNTDVAFHELNLTGNTKVTTRERWSTAVSTVGAVFGKRTFVQSVPSQVVDESELTELERRILAIHFDRKDNRTRIEIADACDCSFATVSATIKRFEESLVQRLALDEGLETGIPRGGRQ
ncbi:hypothetical protein Mal52_36900 [Symmachiella dynata]|uniref:Uncharacterized protein n=1 Tax=Symmachiella dynata TaxID=2527995 RepID=A0A517ZRT9_9PLAN|nr:hypothetical protein [Symmachiella dynata]QDU45199.1 hypothetical protein Mal52_36900 [Symmachiella dynata]